MLRNNCYNVAMSKNSTKEEIEVIFLDVNKDKLEEKLESIGAVKIKDISTVSPYLSDR
jgi:hypothetical protein